METYARCDGRSLHLVQNVSDLLQILEVCTIRIKCTLALRPSRKRVDDKFSSTARMDLKVKTTGHRVLPELQEEYVRLITDTNSKLMTDNRKCLDLRLLPSR